MQRMTICLYNKQCWLVAWSVGDQLLLRHFGPYVFYLLVSWQSFAIKGFWASWDNIYDVCVITVAMVMLLRDLGPYTLFVLVGW
jgi:hypothetical protein